MLLYLLPVEYKVPFRWFLPMYFETTIPVEMCNTYRWFLGVSAGRMMGIFKTHDAGRNVQYLPVVFRCFCRNNGGYNITHNTGRNVQKRDLGGMSPKMKRQGGGTDKGGYNPNSAVFS